MNHSGTSQSPRLRSVPRRRASRRRGTTLAESSAAIVVVGLALAATAQLVALTARQQLRQERRELACQEAANQLERLLHAPWNEQTGDDDRELAPSNELAALLPDARVRLEIRQVAEPLAARQFTVSVESKSDGGERETWTTLVAWKYREGTRP